MKHLSALLAACGILMTHASVQAAPVPSYSICLINKKLVVRVKCPRPSQRITDLSDLTGPAGPTGPTGSVSGTLPSGVTLRGFYSAGGFTQAPDGNSVYYGPISFGFSLSAHPTAHYIAVGAGAVDGCPGNVNQPEASPGHLCVYEDGRLNVNSANVAATAGENTEATFGAIVSVTPLITGKALVNGTWAVTAP